VEEHSAIEFPCIEEYIRTVTDEQDWERYGRALNKFAARLQERYPDIPATAKKKMVKGIRFRLVGPYHYTEEFMHKTALKHPRWHKELLAHKAALEALMAKTGKPMFIGIVPSDGNCVPYIVSGASLVLAGATGDWPDAKQVRRVLSDAIIKDMDDPTNVIVEQWRNGLDSRQQKFKQYPYCCEENTVDREGYKKIKDAAVKYWSGHSMKNRSWLEEVAFTHAHEILGRSVVLFQPFRLRDPLMPDYFQMDGYGNLAVDPHHKQNYWRSYCENFNTTKNEVYVCPINDNHFAFGVHAEEFLWHEDDSVSVD
jgi:hypothetical protein